MKCRRLGSQHPLQGGNVLGSFGVHHPFPSSRTAIERTRSPNHTKPLKTRQKLQGQHGAGFTFLRGPNKSSFPPSFPEEMAVWVVAVLNC